MTKGKLDNGFEFDVNDDILNDWELLELFEEMDQGNPLLIIKVAKKILGSNYNSLKEYCRDENGKVSAIVMSDCIHELFDKIAKN